jgi:hypothetical protein
MASAPEIQGEKPRPADNGGVKVSAARNMLKKALFKQLPDDPQRQLPVESDNTTLLILLKKRKELSSKNLYDILLTSVTDKISGLRDELNYIAFKQYHDVSNYSVLRFPSRTFALARKYSVAKLLSKIYEGPPPAEKYSVDEIPFVDCIIELEFPSRLTGDQVELIKRISDESLREISGSIYYIESNKRYHVYKANNASYPFAHSSIIRGNPGKSRREAQDYWINSHGRLAVNNVEISRQKNYHQIHSVESSKENFEDSYDCLGICFNEFESELSFLFNCLRTDMLQYNLMLVVDELNFLCNNPGLLLRIYDLTRC